MKKRMLSILIATVMLCMMLPASVLAVGAPVQEADGIKFLKDDKTYALNTWVEIQGLLYFFNENGICVTPEGTSEKPDDGFYMIITSYVPYSNGDPADLAENILDGDVVIINDQYYATPEYATSLFNPVVVYENDINPEPYADRAAFADYDITVE